MRFLSTAVAFLAAGASGLSIFGNDQGVISNGELDVPGDSPLQYCEAPSPDDIITIESVTLSPNPPLAGTVLKIEAKGLVKKEIKEGAYVNLQVKYGYIRLVNIKADLCDQIKNVDLECPIEEGIMTIVKEVELPNEIPPGKYVVTADVYNFDEEHVVCLTATVVFKKEGTIFGDL